MKLLYRDDYGFYYLENDKIKRSNNLHTLSSGKINSIKHLDTVDILYHYKDTFGKLFPVYYEHGTEIITKGNFYYIVISIKNMVRDYTIVNLKLL